MGGWEGWERRWQVEVIAEQFSTVGVEIEKAWGSRVGPEREWGLWLSRKQQYAPGLDPYPRSPAAAMLEISETFRGVGGASRLSTTIVFSF